MAILRCVVHACPFHRTKAEYSPIEEDVTNRRIVGMIKQVRWCEHKHSPVTCAAAIAASADGVLKLTCCGDLQQCQVAADRFFDVG